MYEHQNLSGQGGLLGQSSLGFCGMTDYLNHTHCCVKNTTSKSSGFTITCKMKADITQDHRYEDEIKLQQIRLNKMIKKEFIPWCCFLFEKINRQVKVPYCSNIFPLVFQREDNIHKNRQHSLRNVLITKVNSNFFFCRLSISI